MLNLGRRMFASTELAAVSLLVVALILLGIPLKASLLTSVLLIVAVVWQCAVGISIWVRVVKPTRVELVDILGPCLATGAAFTALSWFALCRISWITPRLFALSTVFVAIDGVQLLKTRYQNSDEPQTPILAVSIAILALGYHRIGLLVLGLGLMTVLMITNAVKPYLKISLDKSIVKKLARRRKNVIAATGLIMVTCTIELQSLISRNNVVGFVPDSDSNFGEAIALGVAPNTHLALSPFNSNFRYHWLSHGWLGIMIRSFKLGPFEGPQILVPIVVVTSTVCLVFSAFRRWRGLGSLVPTITALLIVAGCSVTDQLVFATDSSTSNLFGTLWLLLGGFYLYYFLNDCKLPQLIFVGTFLLGFLTMGSKGPLALVLISSALAHTLFSIYDKKNRKQSIESSVGLIFGAITSYLILVSSQINSGGLSFSKPASDVSGYLEFIYLPVILLFTRIPLLFAPQKVPVVNANRFLAVGGASMGLCAFIFKTEGSYVIYFAAGAIALGCFFSGLSSDLAIKNSQHFFKIIIGLSSILFVITVTYHARRIYFTALPPDLFGKVLVDYEAKLLSLQSYLVFLSILIIIFGLVAKKLSRNRMQITIISVMLATTFGVFISDAASGELRQRAVNNNDLDGGPDHGQLVAKAIIKSAKWISEHSNQNAVIATNYSVESSGTYFLVSVASQRPVLIESNNFIFPTLFVDDPETRVIATVEFFNNPNSSSAKALTDQGVQWYLYSIQNDQTSSSDLCAENEIWRCEYKNRFSIAIKFLP